MTRGHDFRGSESQSSPYTEQMEASNESTHYCGGHPGGCGNQFCVPSGTLVSTINRPLGWPHDSNPHVHPVLVRTDARGRSLYACSDACSAKFKALDVRAGTLQRINLQSNIRPILDRPVPDHRFRTELHNGLNSTGSESLLAAADAYGTLPILEGCQLHHDVMSHVEFNGVYEYGSSDTFGEIAKCYPEGLLRCIMKAQSCDAAELDGLIKAQERKKNYRNRDAEHRQDREDMQRVTFTHHGHVD